MYGYIRSSSTKEQNRKSLSTTRNTMDIRCRSMSGLGSDCWRTDAGRLNISVPFEARNPLKNGYQEQWAQTNNNAIVAWTSKSAFWKQQAFEYNSASAVGFGVGPYDKTTTQLYSLVIVLEKKA